MSRAALAASVALCGLDSCTNKLAEKFTTLTLDLTQPEYAALQQVGGSAYASGQAVIVYRASATVAYAYSSSCTHQGCTLPLPAADGIITCPCHGATFNTQGEVLSGPARTNLPGYYTDISGTTITISSKPLTLTLDLTQTTYQALQAVGGATFAGQSDSIIVYRASATTVYAVSSKCTYEGCQLPLPVNGVMTCPCCGSTYNPQGTVLSGPATVDLAIFPAVVSGATIIITLIA
jgi:Rieske Fe-S protein